MFIGDNILQFNNTFSNKERCYEYLFNLKWKDGYTCRRCGGNSSLKGRTKFHVRCRSCDYEESPTANTVFHKIKIPILKAFEMTFRISLSKKAVSSTGLSRDYKIGQHAAWYFKRKLQVAVQMGRKQEEVLASPICEATLIGSANGSFPGELLERRLITRGEDYLLAFSPADLHRLVCFPDPAVQIKFFESNVVFRNFQLWINGIHHHCMVRYLHGYIEEFFFRFHHRNNLELIWHRAIEGFVQGRPYDHQAVRRGLNG